VNVGAVTRARPLLVDDSEDVVAVARRADWRFLLPDPALGRVAYLAPHEPAVAEALGLVSAGEVALDVAATARRAYDTAVLTGGRTGQAAAVAALLRPGGWLYVETTGPATGAWARALRAAGFVDVAAHWLWPDAGRCLEIVPLQRAAIRHALSRRDPGARLRLRARGAGLVASAGLFRFAARHAAVIGRLP
jgi:hypothetical protein